MSITPKISVCMAMYNAATHLRECVDSVLAQTFADFELLIVDDGSTDSSADIVRSYSDSRIRLICRPHDFIASLNTLLSEARGHYIARMDADDIMMPDRLQIQYNYLETHPEVAAVCSQAVRIDSHGQPIGHIGSGMETIRITPRMMCETNHVCNPTTMMRRDIIESENIRYESEYKYAEDYRFWCRVVTEIGAIDCLPQQLLHYRVSDKQVTTTHWDEMMEATERIKSDLIATLVNTANPNYNDPVINESGCELTLIIPFLNEGEEVENTVRSFREFGGDRMEIMVINDCSYDSYPYMERLTAIPGVTYILNRERLGVAASRDKGVSLCRTPYFLLLDAHMRAYDDLWTTEIPRLLHENDRRILCCQNKPLEKNQSGNVTEDNDTPIHYGARLVITRRPPVPGIDWFDEEREPDKKIETIPAVLGAGYATSRTYWQKIGGLKGLRQYGCDEQLISLKTWLEGGKCVLLKHVKLGHIYRKTMPYSVNWSVPIFNNLLITETLFPLRERIMARASAYVADYKRFLTAFSQIRDYLAKNPDMRLDGPEHRKRFDRFLGINSNPLTVTQRINVDISGRLEEIRNVISSDMPCDSGLYEGKMGRALWLLLYAQVYKDPSYRDMAMTIIREVFDNLPVYEIGFASGLSGIGWATLYLEQTGLIVAPTEVMSKIDEIILTSYKDVHDTSFASGTAGILAYICARLASYTFRKSIARHFQSIDSLANEILNSTNDTVAAYEALMWFQLRSRDFVEVPSLYLTDWMQPSNFVARDKNLWSLSLCDGVLATSLNVINSNY